MALPRHLSEVSEENVRRMKIAAQELMQASLKGDAQAVDLVLQYNLVDVNMQTKVFNFTHSYNLYYKIHVGPARPWEQK